MTKPKNLNSQPESLLAKNSQLSITPALALPTEGPPKAALIANPKSNIQNPKSRKIRRNGRVASIPKLQRDMVNHMLWNGVPYKNIVGALDEAGFTVTERNISNWATGGYLEWSLAQEHILENRLDQD